MQTSSTNGWRAAERALSQMLGTRKLRHLAQPIDNNNYGCQCKSIFRAYYTIYKLKWNAIKSWDPNIFKWPQTWWVRCMILMELRSMAMMIRVREKRNSIKLFLCIYIAAFAKCGRQAYAPGVFTGAQYVRYTWTECSRFSEKKKF